MLVFECINKRVSTAIGKHKIHGDIVEYAIKFGGIAKIKKEENGLVACPADDEANADKDEGLEDISTSLLHFLGRQVLRRQTRSCSIVVLWVPWRARSSKKLSGIYAYAFSFLQYGYGHFWISQYHDEKRNEKLDYHWQNSHNCLNLCTWPKEMYLASAIHQPTRWYGKETLIHHT